MESNAIPIESFAWTTFYMEFADQLLHYKHKRSELLALIESVYKSLGMKFPFTDNGVPETDICPFTVFGCFNKGITDENRKAIMGGLGNKLGVQASIPERFDGIPLLNNMAAKFYGNKTTGKPDDISNLWDVFEAGMQYADSLSEVNKNAFIGCYDKVRKQYGIKWNLTIGLFWIRPLFYLNLDETNRSYLMGDSNPFHEDLLKISSLKQLPSATTYLQLIAFCQECFKKIDSHYHSFPELSHRAWIGSSPVEPSDKSSNASRLKRDKTEKRYWMYAPGNNASKWDEYYAQGVLGIGWDEMGNLTQYASKEEMKVRMKELYGKELSYKNSAHATWQFATEMEPGDVVYAKKGMYKIIGRGVVQSAYMYDEDRDEFKHIRKVGWTHKGEWEHPGQAVTKVLTDITDYTEYVQKLEALFLDDVIIGPLNPIIEPYNAEEFLREVFMGEECYDTLVSLLDNKKNLILSGAPGVGKTFSAKRLAYSIMGEKDTSRVMMIQFHQSYSYEDFIMGFRPARDGFVLTQGPFYKFCKEAADDGERKYFFIIDEINRGNLSKIFGELLMLIERDKRGEKLRLLYSNELFSVPPNVYIIGMMNTADRSLAMIDYALRRRFAFFELEPAFDSEGFQAIMSEAAHPKFTALVEQIKALNNVISKDESLGTGFQIGHSYLCPNGEITDQWLTSIVKFELLPLLNEYWFDEQTKVGQWTKKLCDVLND